MTEPARTRRSSTTATASRAAAEAKHRTRTSQEGGAAGTLGAVEFLLVGITSIPHHQLSAIKELENRRIIRVAALVDDHDDAAERLRESFPTAIVARSLESVVAAPGAVAALASPPHAHLSQANGAWRRGWHVLTLSAIAATSADANAMIAAARRHERQLAVWMPWRALPSIRYLKTLCRDQLLGPLFGLSVHDGLPNAAGDGVLLQVGAFAFDLLTWIIGPPTLVSYADDAMGGVEVNADIELSFAEGAGGTVHLSADWPTTTTYEFLFERAVVQWKPTSPAGLLIQLANAPAVLDAKAVGLAASGTQSSDMPSDGYAKQLETIVAATRGLGALPVAAAEALTALAFVEKCRATRTLIDQPWLTHNEKVHARSLSVPL